MISYGDMLDTIEKIEPQNPPSVAEKKGGDNEPEKKDSEPEKEKLETDEPEDVI